MRSPYGSLGSPTCYCGEDRMATAGADEESLGRWRPVPLLNWNTQIVLVRPLVTLWSHDPVCDRSAQRGFGIRTCRSSRSFLISGARMKSGETNLFTIAY